MMSSNSPTPQFDIREKMTDFPCAFNLETADKVPRARFLAVEHNISNELISDDDSDEEKIRSKNMLAWVLFRLDKEEKAVELNDEVLELTNWNNMAAVGNRVFIMFNSGDEIESKACLKKLEEMKARRELWTEARAEQAYYYSRLGSVCNFQLSIKLYEESLQANPGKSLWRYCLGLVYRRMTNSNLYCSSPEKLDVTEFTKKAAECLFAVAQKEALGDCRLRGEAYAELVVLRRHNRYDHITFKGMSIHRLCDEALKYAPNQPTVLTNCGMSMKGIDVDKAISLLEASVKRRPESIAYSHLGLSYEKKATLICSGDYKKKTRNEAREAANLAQNRDFPGRHPEYQRSQSQRPKIYTQVGAYVQAKYSHPSLEARNCNHSKAPRQAPTLDPNDELVKKALNSYDKAIEVSASQNIPVILNKGLLLRRSSQLKEALKQFNKVTNFTDKSESHRLSAISAYEQAGLCYLELHKTAKQPNTYYEDAEKKLKRAISLAADLASTDTELKTCATDLWDSFRVLDSERHKLPSELERNKTLIQLLKLVRDYNQIVEVVGRIIRQNEEVLDDPEFIKSGIQSYLKIMEFENALTFLNMASTRQSLIESDFWMSQTMTDLKEKTLIGAAENRLRDKQGDAKTVFQQLFKFVYGQCAGTDPETVDDTETPGGLQGDVLFVYDTSLDTRDGLSSVSMSVQCLQDVFTKIFGLVNSCNIEDCSDYMGVEYEIQLNWMAKYRVVIVMIGHEDRLYEYFLKNAPYCSDASTLLVINNMTDTSKVPASLKSRPCLSLYEVGGFQAALPEGGRVNTDEFISKVFDDDVEAVMKLFRFLIGKQ